MTYKQIQSVTLTDGRVVNIGETWVVCGRSEERSWTVVAIFKYRFNTNVFILVDAAGLDWTDAPESGMVRKVQPYENFKVDDKVLVRDEGDTTWSKRHFAGVASNGKALAFSDGRTSFTASAIKAMEWDECISYDESMEEQGRC